MKSTMMDITDFKMDEFVPYVEREVWSPRFFRWHKYEVRRPRLVCELPLILLKDMETNFSALAWPQGQECEMGR
jgi:hypothetical protein